MDPGLLARVLITDRRLHGGADALPERVAEAALRYGATLVVLREKDLADDDLLVLAGRVRDATPIPVVLAHRPDLAARAGLDGVHLGWNSPGVTEARSQLGHEGIVGVSVHGLPEVESRSLERPDWLLLGPVKATPSKRRRIEPLGFETLRDAAALTELPLVGIGGLGPGDEEAVRAAGATGWAGIRAFAGLKLEDS